MRQCQRLTIWSGCPAQAKEKTGRGDPRLTIFVRGPTDVDPKVGDPGLTQRGPKVDLRPPRLTIFVRGPTDVDGNAVPDPHFADILGNAFKKLSEQSIKEIYAKDKSGKKVSTDDDEADADLRKELASTKKQLEKANNKLASFGRQHGLKEDLSGAKSKKDDKAKSSKPKDKDMATSSEGAAQ